MDLNASLITSTEMKDFIIISFLIFWDYYCLSFQLLNLLNNSFNLFLIIDLVLTSYNSGSKRFKILILKWHMQLLEELDCITSRCFSTSSGVFGKIWSNAATFLRFCFSISLVYNVSLTDLKYSSEFMTARSFTSSSVKVF